MAAFEDEWYYLGRCLANGSIYVTTKEMLNSLEVGGFFSCASVGNMEWQRRFNEILSSKIFMFNCRVSFMR